MVCPNCGVNLKQAERPNHTCSKCHQRFAFDPKENSLGLHDVRVRRAAEALSQQWRWRYTTGQLLHRLAQKHLRTKASPINKVFSILIVGVILIIVGGLVSSGLFKVVNLVLSRAALSPEAVAYVQNALGLVTFFVQVGILVVSIVWMMKASRKVELPMKPAQFAASLTMQWVPVYGALPQGMIDTVSPNHLSYAQPTPPAAQVRAVVVADDADALVCLAVNRAPHNLGIQLLPVCLPEEGESALAPEQRALLERLRREPRLPLLLLHAASYEGVLLREQVRKNLKLDPQHTVIDVGLSPATAIVNKLVWLAHPPSKQVLAQLDQLEKAGTLSKKEAAWLRRGRSVPLAMLTPVRLIKMVVDALKQVPAAQPAAADDAETQARAVGFMTWPTR